MKKLGVAIVGATGAIGQQFIRFVSKNPQFNIECLTASDNSVGKKYSDSAQWYAEFGGEGMPEVVKDIVITKTSVQEIKKTGNIDIIFSALPTEESKILEPQFAKEGMIVVTKSSAFRLDEYVPLLIPEVNPEHLEIIEHQKKAKNWEGAIVADPNCTTTGFALTLKPIYDSFGIKNIFVVTMQATSGAGYRNLSPVAINDNLLPFIKGEEEKTEKETLKVLGKYESAKVAPANITISASCNRVNVDYGHMEDVFLETQKPCEPEDVKKIMKDFVGLPQKLKLPSAPKHPIHVREEEDRPQPKLDVNTENGMSVVVGRVRKCDIFKNGIKYTLLVHNTVRGGAGMAVLNAELLVSQGYA